MHQEAGGAVGNHIPTPRRVRCAAIHQTGPKKIWPRTRRCAARLLAVSVVSISLSACALDYDIPPPKYDAGGVYPPVVPATLPVAQIGSYADVTKAAEYFADYYRARSNYLFAGTELLEIPLIAGGIAAANEALFNNKSRPLEDILLAAGGVTAFENYLAPRARAAIAADGMSAMLCLQSIASQQVGIHVLINRDRPAERQLVFGAIGIAIADPDTVQILDEQQTDWSYMAGGILKINLRIAVRERSQTAQPDFQKVADELEKAANQKAATAQTLLLRGHLAAAQQPLDVKAETDKCVALAG